MKRLVLSLTTAAVLVVGSAAAAFAQTPPTNQPYWGHMGGWAGGYSGKYDPANNPTLTRLAEKIGIAAADLAKELQAGKSLAEVAQGKNVGEQTLVDVLLAPQADSLKLRVEYGYLTQEQADNLLKFRTDQIKYQINQKGFLGGFGHGMMGGFSGMMGGGFGGGMMGPGFGGMMGGFGSWTPNRTN